MFDETSSQYIDLIKKNTEFKSDTRAKAVVATLKWLDAGAPEALEKLDGEFKFDMSCFLETYRVTEDPDEPVKGCGTVCCIAGAIHLHEMGSVSQINVRDSLIDIFNMSDDSQLLKLFLCRDSEMYMHQVTAIGAAVTLRRYIETGKVEWNLEEQRSHLNVR